MQSDYATMMETKPAANGLIYRYIFVLVDVFSELIYAKALADKSKGTAVKTFESLITEMGNAPKCLEVDAGAVDANYYVIHYRHWYAFFRRRV